MASKRNRQTALTEELQNYLYNNFTAEDDLLRSIAENCWLEAGIPQINISSYQANFLQFLVKSISAKNILEIGTLAGYSAITLARAAGNDCKVLTIEKNISHAEYAKKNIVAANLSENIEVVAANGLDFIKKYTTTLPLDFIFLDADKSNYYKYLTLLTPHLRQGGLLVADNAFAFGFLLDSAVERNPAEVRSMLNFHRHLLKRSDYFTSIVPIGDGMLISVKL